MPFGIRPPRMLHDREMLRFHINGVLAVVAIIFVRSFDSYQNSASEQYSTGFGRDAVSNGTDLLLQHQRNLVLLSYAMGLCVISALLLLLAHLADNTLAFDITLFAQGPMCLAAFYHNLARLSISTSWADQVSDAILLLCTVSVFAVFVLH